MRLVLARELGLDHAGQKVYASGIQVPVSGGFCEVLSGYALDFKPTMGDAYLAVRLDE